MELNEVKLSFVTALAVSSILHKPEVVMCINWTNDKNYTQNEENPTSFFVYPTPQDLLSLHVLKWPMTGWGQLPFLRFL
jgi:hypothetical protein